MKKGATLLTILVLFTVEILSQQKELTLQTMFTERGLYGSSLSGVKWFANDTKYSFLKLDTLTRSTAIFQHDIKSGKEAVLVTKNDLRLPNSEEYLTIQNYEWSPNEKYILLTGLVSARAVKSGGAFYIYDIEAKKLSLLAESEEEQINAGFSPDSRKLGFVRGNNLYVADIQTGATKQLTFDGSDVILNGLFDWVYEEEFSIIKGWEWSPDSKSIAFWRLDQSPVPEIQIAKWDSLYLNFLNMRYPKPGARNSIIKIGVVDIAGVKTNWMDIGDEIDIYIPRIKYTKDPSKLSIQRLNRLQNKLDFIIADTKTGKSNIIFTEKSEAWIEIFDDLTFLPDGKRFIWTSEKDGFKHIYLFDYTGKQLSQLTKGSWETGDVLFADDNQVIFNANERGVRYTDLYKVNVNGKSFKRITDKPGSHSVQVSSDGKYFIDKYSNVFSITSIALYNNNGDKIRDIGVPDNKILEDYGFTKPEFITFKASDGVELNGVIIKPWNFDENKKYPVLFDIYGGPGSSPAKDRWGGISYVWLQYLAKNGYIIFGVDNRGTSGRGTAFKHTVYKRLGEMEVNDMVEGAKYLSNLKYVDASRLGIWGWSYGGYMAALTITRAADYFKTAVAVAPVTHWKFYDTIYTERYMQTPELNPEGYEESSVMHYTRNYKGNLLLIHGTADDNVHFQNSVALVSKLISENKQFRTMFYPEKDHGIRGGLTTQQLYKMMTDFILEKL